MPRLVGWIIPVGIREGTREGGKRGKRGKKREGEKKGERGKKKRGGGRGKKRSERKKKGSYARATQLLFFFSFI